MAFAFTVNSDHTLTFSSNTLAYQNEANVPVTVTLDATVTAHATGKLSYIDFILPDGTAVYKGSYDGSTGTILTSIGGSDNVLTIDGRVGMQFVVRDVAPPNSTDIWKSEIKYAKVLASVNATNSALAVSIPDLVAPDTYPAEYTSLADAGGYFASNNVEDAMQEIGSGSTPAGDAILAFGLTKTQLFNEFSLLLHPVGSIYESTNSTSPTTLFGGTWAAFGAGRVTVGLDAGQTEFDTVEKTGGEKTHVLTEAELAAHDHGVLTGDSSYPAGASLVAGFISNKTSSDYLNSTSSGSDTAHNNLQPYIVVYRWKRTA